MKGIRELIRESVREYLDEKSLFTEIFSENNKYKGIFKKFSNVELENIIEFLKGVIIRTNSGLNENIGKITLRNLFFKTPEEFRNYFKETPNSRLWRGDDELPCDDEDYEKYDFFLQSFSNKNTANFFGDIIWPSTDIYSYGGSFSTVKFNRTIKRSDIMFLNSFLFYNEYDMFSEVFTREEFFVIYNILTQRSLFSRKYKNKLKNFFSKNNNDFLMAFNNVFNYELGIGDDEGEVMFFDVVYKCKK